MVMARREKRRLLDAQRGKCRVRLGSHLDEWCALKDHLGFAQHAQVAKFLLDSYISTTGSGTCAPTTIALFSVSLASLKRLAVLCHQHARDCPTPPAVLSTSQSGQSLEMPVLLWGCKEHQFSWNPRDCTEANLADTVKGLKTPETLPDNTGKQEKNPKVGTRESKRREEILSSTKTCPQVAFPEPTNRESLSKGDQSFSKCSESIVEHEAASHSEDRVCEEKSKKTQSLKSDAQDLLVSEISKNGSKSPSKRIPEEAHSNLVSDIPSDTETSMEICPVEESIVEEVIGTNESSEDSECSPVDEESQMGQSSDPHPAKVEDQQSIKKANRPKPYVDEELAQICKKRIRKATHPEMLMCEYEDCGKIFSKRQYLNYHQKYQHMNQRTFRCSVTDCGKTFNFKKHLKEHEKRHSDRRDYICEFCARAFRSSSNLIIHRRIHTGEKPLQCEFCGFTCRQKASLNWHMKKHDAPSFYQFPCDLCGQRFEKRENLAAHKNRKHPECHEAAPLPAVEEDIVSGETSSLTDLATGDECPKDIEHMATAPQDNIKETVLHEYLDLADRVLETQSSARTPASTNIPVVIVL